jgi:hypothetical protein
MPTDPENEPEKYTLDEMMQRLKERGHEEGELVTRSDGTVAVKVRKRKRRSKQPHKDEAKRNQRIKLLQLGAVFLCITAVIGVAAGMLFYYNSSSFRESIREKIAAWTAAEVEIADFSVTPNNAKFASTNFTWPEGNYLRELQLTQTSAHLDLSSFIGNKWGGSNVLSKSGKLSFSAAIPDAVKRVGESPANKPFPFTFSSYRCEKLDIVGLGKDRQPWMTVEGTESSLIKTTRGAQTRFVGGVVKLAGFPPLQLDRSSIYFEQGQMRIEHLRLKPTNDTGTLELINSVELYSPESAEIEILLSGFPLENLLGNDLDVILIGHVDTPKDALNRLFSFVPGEWNTLKIQIGFAGSERDSLTLMNLPFLDELSREFRNPEYAQQYEFTDRVAGEMLRAGNTTQIKGLHLEKKGNFIIKGDINSTNGILSGTLEVGLPSSLFLDPEMNPGLKEVFSRQDEGFQWCRVQLSGTPGQPKDDFSSRVQQALAKSQGTTSTTPAPSNNRTLDIEKELEGN